ncbi:DUF488 domain-containing protein [Pontiellaceae bacterium B12219]|nr:DUF488 domain-containing protein [Pontiellaceae bacterium B12219]
MIPKQIEIKRIYDPVSPSDGWRALVDRLWPRGISKAAAEIDEWNKDISPSTELRKWYGHDPEKWESFSEAYQAELKTKKIELTQLLTHCPERTLTLLFAAKDVQHCHALVLKKELENIKRTCIHSPN